MNNPIAIWPRLLDLKTAAAYLSVGSRTIEDWLKDGILEAVPMPGSTIRDKSGNIIARAKTRKIVKTLIDREDLDRLITDRRAAR
jgi:excisionase family DNA binding protein